MENPRFKVRPFERLFDADSERPLRASTTLDGNEVLVKVNGSEHRLRAVERGRDEWGEFVFIEPGEWKLNFGFVLTVEVDLDEDEPYGCRIALTRPQPEEALKRAHDAVRAQGMDPESANVLLPPSVAVAVYFDHWGTMRGHSRLRSAPPADTQSRTH